MQYTKIFNTVSLQNSSYFVNDKDKSYFIGFVDTDEKFGYILANGKQYGASVQNIKDIVDPLKVSYVMCVYEVTERGKYSIIKNKDVVDFLSIDDVEVPNNLYKVSTNSDIQVLMMPGTHIVKFKFNESYKNTERLFSDLSTLTAITFPDNSFYDTIPGKMIEGSTKCTTVNLSNSIKTINYLAFNNSYIEYLNIPGSVTTISNMIADNSTPNLKKITFMKDISGENTLVCNGSTPFIKGRYNCDNLECIEIIRNNIQFQSTEDPFYYCTYINTIIIHNSLPYIKSDIPFSNIGTTAQIPRKIYLKTKKPIDITNNSKWHILTGARGFSIDQYIN